MLNQGGMHMNATDLLQKIGETLGSTATVKSVFGEPIHANGKTVVPVAKIAYGFGGGSGTGKAGPLAEHQGEGGGGGGGVRAFPAGALEITDNGTRFVPFIDLTWLAAAFTAGVVLSGLMLTRPIGNVRGRMIDGARAVTRLADRIRNEESANASDL
jgi:uncharacterized spore protein YtfJ